MNIPMWPISRQIISPLQYRPEAYTILAMPQSLIIVLCVWIPPLNSTVKTQNAKRAFQNARSERRGEVIVVFGSQKPPIIFFGPCKKDPLCHTNSFNQFSRSVSTTELIALRWNLWEVSQNLFLSVKKRIREGILTCPTNLVRPETFLLHPKKDLDLGRSAPRIFSGGFIHHFEPIRALKILFYFGGKRFQCPGPGNTLTLGYWKKGSIQNARSETRVFKTAFRRPNRTSYGRCFPRMMATKHQQCGWELVHTLKSWCPEKFWFNDPLHNHSLNPCNGYINPN